MKIYQALHDVPAAAPLRNGNRWRVAAVDGDRNRIAARRLSDGSRAIFDGDYVRAHITHGYAVTVHAAQAVTADTSHAVLGENTSRAALYVAMTPETVVQNGTRHRWKAPRSGRSPSAPDPLRPSRTPGSAFPSAEIELEMHGES